MSQPIRRIQQQQPPHPVAPPDPVLNGEIVDGQRAGLAAVSRLQSAAFATWVGMNNACMLSKVADQCFRISPMGEEMYRGLVMAYGSVAVYEVQSLGGHGRGRQ
jgi:hypothetical protein